MLAVHRRSRFQPPLNCAIALGLSFALLSRPEVSSRLAPITHANATQDKGSLSPAAKIEREIAGGEAHSYSLALSAGDFVRLAVEQRGIDLVITLRSSDGKPPVRTASAIGFSSQQRLAFVAELAGDYQLTVRSSRSAAARGAYTLNVEDWRPVEPKDENTLAGERLFAEAEQLTLQGNAGATRRGIEKFEAALPFWRAAGDRLLEAFTLLKIGLALHNLSAFKEALDRYNQALPIFEAIGEERGVAHTLTNLGWSHAGLGQLGKAIGYYKRSLEIRRRLGEPRSLAQTLTLVADALQATGDPQQAIERYQEALPLALAARDQAIEAFTLNGLGWLYNQMGEYGKALDSVEQALPLWRLAGNRYGEAQSLNIRGTMHVLSWFPVDEALKSFEQANQIWKEIGNRYGEAQVLNNTGVLYLRLRDYERARETSLQALVIWQAIGNRNEEGNTLNNLGLIEGRLGRMQPALDYFQQSLALHTASGNRNGQAASLHNIGGVHRHTGKFEQALHYQERALKLTQETGQRQVEAYVLSELGSNYEHLGDDKRAFDFYHRTLSMPLGTGAFDLARMELRRRNLSEALALLERAVHDNEERRGRITDQQLRVSHTAGLRDIYELRADILMRLHERASASNEPSEKYLTAALETSERARARSLLETLAEARADIRQGADPDLLAAERSAQDRLNAREKRRVELLNSAGQEKRLAAVEKEIQELERELQDARARIRARSPAYAALTQPAPLGASEIQRLLDDDTLLLEYLLGKERSFLWLVTPTSIKGYALPGRAEIETHVRRLYQLLTKPKPHQTSPGKSTATAQSNATADYDKVAATLSRILLEPVAGQLGKKRLLIVADGALQYLPFAALPVPEARRESSDRRVAVSPRPRVGSIPLIADHEIVSLPSASVLAELRRELTDRKRAPKALAVLADPVFDEDDARVAQSLTLNGATLQTSPFSAGKLKRTDLDLERSSRDAGLNDFGRLRFSRQEADTITALLPEKDRLKALDFAASRATAQSAELGQYRILHFATHGLINSKHPELSGLVFSLIDEKGQPQDGFLRFHEIYNLKLNAELVVLSACQTALGKEVRGEGLIGLTRGFMYAGAPRVVASLWRVDDRATAELMKRFYEGMLRGKLRPAAALRAAQVQMSKLNGWEAPFYWGGFVLQGEWK